MVFGCPKAAEKEEPPQTTNASQTATLHRDELFEIAIDTLNRLYQFDGTDMAIQVADRLDQWIRTQKPLEDWRPDPLLETLPPELRELPEVKNLAELHFTRDDAFSLQTAVWLRDIAAWARGDGVDELSRARALFDWVVFHVQLDPLENSPQLSNGELLLRTPWQTLLLGHGSATARAWVYLLLCRQEGLDAAMLAVNVAAEGQEPRWEPWAVGVAIEGKIYVFEPSLGFPIPAEDGLQMIPGQGLEIEPATLQELAENESLLRRLDADPRNPYRVKPSMVRSVQVMLEGSAVYLSQRMEMVARMLAGGESLLLTAHPGDEAARFRGLFGVEDVSLWPLPYRALLQRQAFAAEVNRYQAMDMLPFMIQTESMMPLWRARVLHLKGDLLGEESATAYYQAARPAQRLLDSSGMNSAQEMMYIQAKLNASYWLGLISVWTGNRKAAEDLLINRTALSVPGQPWEPGVAYALGRLNEKLGDYPRAIAAYRADVHLPSRFGNLVRARWIEELTGAKPLDISRRPANGTQPAKESAEESREDQLPQKEGPGDSPSTD
ncbi:MAG: hypothetical protein GYA33_09960 [Thermogutta sp.]|nr:hypothetical protein [Thermogutta sp.]